MFTFGISKHAPTVGVKKEKTSQVWGRRD